MSLVTLLTDFGWASPYPGQMKGVLRSLCRAALIDRNERKGKQPSDHAPVIVEL